jgi:hypothetical protein
MGTSVSPWLEVKWGLDQPPVSNTAERVAATIAARARNAAEAQADDAKVGRCRLTLSNPR